MFRPTNTRLALSFLLSSGFATPRSSSVVSAFVSPRHVGGGRSSIASFTTAQILHPRDEVTIRSISHVVNRSRRCNPTIPTTTRSASSTNGDTTTTNDVTYGIGMDQNDMMESDLLVAVDYNDNPISTLDLPISKRRAHEFNTEQPRGIAHRAFSIFLFNSKNELLLTRRALSKITFPGVWTNTCCSHPLHNMIPNEVDNDWPSYPGIKYGAIRKLKHELGIDPKFVPHDQFHFLTRFHYWAADTVTYGTDAPWGEHEIDYVLFIKCPEGKEPIVDPNPEEVSEWKYVSAEELRTMMSKDNNDDEYLWSPWFRGIMERGGYMWWDDMDESLKGGESKYCNQDITYFDPPKEHWGSYNLESHGRETGVLSNKEEATTVSPTAGSK